MLTARPETPKLAAVRAAPTVPEWRTARPVLGPGLIPETMTAGGAPKPPRRAAITARAGGPSTPKQGACTPGSSSSSTSMVSSACMRPMAALLPLMSSWGAATTTSWPAATTAAASGAMPGALTPSSFVTRTRTLRRGRRCVAVGLGAAVDVPEPLARRQGGAGGLAGGRLAGRAGVLGQPARADVPHPLADVDGVVADALVVATHEGQLHGGLEGDRLAVVALEDGGDVLGVERV